MNYFKHLQIKYPNFDPTSWIAPTLKPEFHSINIKLIRNFKTEPFKNVTVFTPDRTYHNADYYHEGFKERYFVVNDVIYKGKAEFLYILRSLNILCTLNALK